MRISYSVYTYKLTKMIKKSKKLYLFLVNKNKEKEQKESPYSKE